MHWVQALIAPEQTLTEAPRLMASAVVCPLAHGFALVPVTEPLEHDLGASEFASSEPSPPLAPDMAKGVASLAARLSLQGPVLYAATFIFGGTGSQQALIWENGKLVLSLIDPEGSMSEWPNSSVSRALRHIGVKAAEGKDEFDTVGLGRHRSNEDWAEAKA